MDKSFDSARAKFAAIHNPQVFQRLQVAIVADVCGSYQAHEPKLLERALALSDFQVLFQRIQETALEICGSAEMQGKQLDLLKAIQFNCLSFEVSEAIYQYLMLFDTEKQHLAHFLKVAKYIVVLKDASKALNEAQNLLKDLLSTDALSDTVKNIQTKITRKN